MDRPPALRVVCLLVVGFLPSRCAAPPPPHDGRAIADEFGLVIAPAPPSGVAIRVVDDASGAAVADALVVAVDETMFGWICGEDGEPEHDAAWRMRDLGVASLSDRAGATRVPLPTRPMTVMAFHGERFGRATVEAHDPLDQVVRIAPRTLEVEVVDAEGRPLAGVPVALDTPCNVHHELGFVRESDARGRVTIEGHDLERNVHWGCGRETVVEFSFPSRAYALRAIDDAQIEPVRLVAPPTSRLVVELRDLDDRPLGAPALVKCVTWLPWIERHDFDPFWPELGWQRESWRRSDGGRVDLGPFEIGLLASVSVECAGYEFEPQTFAPPGTAGETRVVVMRAHGRSEEKPSREYPPEVGSSVEATVLVDDPVIRERLALELRPERADGNESNESTPDHRVETWSAWHGSRVVVRDVPPGRFRATLVVGDPDDRRATLAEWDGLVVPERGVLRDPRLQAIDLRGRFVQYLLEVVDETGRPLHGVISVESADGAVDTWQFSEGREDLIGLTPIRRATLFANGRRTVTISPVAARQRVVLERGWPIRVALPPAIRLPVGFVLGVSLLTERGDEVVGATSGESEVALLGPDGTALLHVGGPGRYSMSVELLRLGEGGDSVTGMSVDVDADGDGEDDVIVIDEALLAGDTVIPLPLTAEALSAAIDFVREDDGGR